MCIDWKEKGRLISYIILILLTEDSNEIIITTKIICISQTLEAFSFLSDSKKENAMTITFNIVLKALAIIIKQ